MKYSLKKYSSLFFVLIGIIVLYILFNVFNKKEGGLRPVGPYCNTNADCSDPKFQHHVCSRQYYGPKPTRGGNQAWVGKCA